ncbi:glycosyl hydrolase catalytic core-domain-containing protein [Podospora australis]|uniref:Glycosyl hydrolase catalytic core-domain-containing protein n=1 Tax=Podospora australis TaxID=1536484 RepID=A0AAN6WPY0_9PEZI|nr:glycosyl hydrolase catalytic core-domain-containing protein [Podospora australis]
MHLLTTTLLSALAATTASAQAVTKNPKRGLVSTPHVDFPEDSTIWSDETTPLSWYWNFANEPGESYKDIPQEKFEFVPTMWGAYTSNGTDTFFLGNLTALMKTRKISHVITFNLPDWSFDKGGSQMSPEVGARVYVNNILPLREQGVKVSLPTVSDPKGSWIEPFMNNCTKLNDDKPCEFDFVPLHSFGGLGTLKENIGKWEAAFPGKPIWVTEFGYADQELITTENFLNQSLKYLDEHKTVERYAWFGAFREQNSNVGPNMAMLTSYGNLTNVGNWYLGKQTTEKPGQRPANANHCTADNPCGGSGTKKNAGVRMSVGEVAGWLMVGFVQLGMFFL